jgi:serine/threonine-protein kinase Chk1
VSDLYCGTQSGSTQTGQTHQTRFQRLVKRMTRLWVGRDARQTEEYMREMLAKMAYGCKVHTKGILTIECEDRRGNCLIFKAMIIDVDKKILVDFRLSRGCGIEFKKHFAKIKKNLGPILETSPAPILWPEVIPVEAIHGILV